MQIDEGLEITDSSFKLFNAVPEEKRTVPAHRNTPYFL